MKLEEMKIIYLEKKEAIDALFDNSNFIDPCRYHAHGYVPAYEYFKDGKFRRYSDDIEESGELGIINNVRYFKIK